jgi:hypothetical protein
METNVKQVAEQILLAIEDSPKVKSIDSTDQDVTRADVNKYTFVISKYKDATLQGAQRRRGPGGIKPLHMEVYTVTIEGSISEVADEDDDSGFLFEGIWVTDPTMDVEGREAVNPWTYYGDAYREFRTKKGLTVPEKK